MARAFTPHERVLERIRAGELIESAEEMSQEYHAHLVNLMQMQADSELAGAFGYVPWIMKAPAVPDSAWTAGPATSS